MRRIRSVPVEGEERYQTLMNDIAVVEKSCSLKILPEAAYKQDAITVFTREEAQKDLKANGKYNKKSALQLSIWFKNNTGVPPNTLYSKRMGTEIPV